MRAIGAAFLLLSALAFVWAVVAYRSQRRFLSSARRVNGVVQSVTAERGDKGPTYYFPVISFTTDAGVTVTQASKSGRNTPYRIGQPIPVIYDPKHPEDLEIDAFWSRWLVVIAALFLALVFLGIAARLLYPSPIAPPG